MWINTIPVRMQRIIRYRIFEGMTWEQVAIRMGRGATEISMKKSIRDLWIKINFVTNVTHVTNQSGIVYHEAKGL